MIENRRALLGADVVGVGRLAIDAVSGLTDVVEAMHGTIARRPFPVGRLPETRTRGLTRFVYQCIRAATRVAGGGLDAALPHLRRPQGASSARRDVMVSILNGLIGDHLAATRNPLGIAMTARSGGAPVDLSRQAPGKRLLLLVHGLCMADRQWRRNGHDHGEALARALGYTPLYLHYNTGRHVSENGRELAGLLEQAASADEIAILGHSMGGLVARSAVHHARAGGRRWVGRLSALVFLGTPHHGTPLERAGNLLDLLLEISPYAAPLARIGGNRSAGIADLRFGNLLDEDWDGRPRRYRHDPRTPVPLPEGVRCFTVAATRGRRSGDLPDRLLGDGLVPVGSALGHHRDPRHLLAFPAGRQMVAYESGHFDLLDAPEISRRLVDWLKDG